MNVAFEIFGTILSPTIWLNEAWLSEALNWGRGKGHINTFEWPAARASSIDAFLNNWSFSSGKRPLQKERFSSRALRTRLIALSLTSPRHRSNCLYLIVFVREICVFLPVSGDKKMPSELLYYRGEKKKERKSEDCGPRVAQ